MAAMSPPTEFLLFPHLPKELRLMIWEAAAGHRRTVVLRAPPQDHMSRIQRLIAVRLWRARVQQQPKEGPPPTWYRPTRRLGWTTPTRPPSILYVTRESRSVALKAYRLAFGWEGLPPAVWANFDADDVLVTRADCLGDGSGEDGGARARERLERVWLTTPDADAIQRVIACGMDVDEFKAFLGTPKQAFWSYVYPDRAQGFLLRGLETWTNVHVQQVWQAIGTLTEGGEGRLRDRIQRRLVETIQAVGLGGQRRAAERARRVLVSHDSGACLVTEAPMVGGLGKRPLGGAESPAQADIDGVLLTPMHRFSKILVEGFCLTDGVGGGSKHEGSVDMAAQWASHTESHLRVQRGADKRSPVVMAQRTPPSCARLFCLVHYGTDLRVVVGS